jgi:parallel beta-helix repeat protein
MANPGISISSSLDNIIFKNNITSNDDGLFVGSSSGNKIYHNNFINNTNQVFFWGGVLANFWDDDYPSGGNYWSDYTGIDEKNGPNQDLPRSDGIGDSPYVIDENNQDRYLSYVTLVSIKSFQ